MIRVIMAFAATYGAGIAALLFVAPTAEPWYESVIKPAFAPPFSLFIIIWLVLYTLMALVLSIVWRKDPDTSLVEGWARFYFVQLLFSVAWIAFFFGFHAILIAFITALFLGLIVAALMASAPEIDRRIVYLLLPYLACIVFAAYLTLQIWMLN